jgi:hypothetical protein
MVAVTQMYHFCIVYLHDVLASSSCDVQLTEAADAARLSFGMPTREWSTRKRRKAYLRGQLPWGESPCLQVRRIR